MDACDKVFHKGKEQATGLTGRSTRTLPLPVTFTTATRRFGSAG